MYRETIAAMVIFGIGFLGMADFTEDFQEAAKTFGAGKDMEAYNLFVSLAKQAPKSGAKSDALRQAVLAAIKAKQFQKAEELVPLIPRESTRKLCAMDLLLAQGKSEELVALFQVEKIADTWSDFHALDGLITRGKAYLILRRTAEALKDFQAAKAFAITPLRQAQVLDRLAFAYVQAGDTDHALAAWRRLAAIPELRNYTICLEARLNVAKTLAGQGKFDEALKELEPLQSSGSRADYWDQRKQKAMEEIHKAKTAASLEAVSKTPEEISKENQLQTDKLK